MRILITGSSGRLGRQLVLQLCKEHEVIGIDLIPSETTHIQGSTSNRTLIDSLFSQKFDVVIHTAALHARHLNTSSYQDFIDANITGTLILLEVAHRNGCQKFIMTSSTSIYGKALVDHDSAVWVDEKLTSVPRDIYDITKQAAENLCVDFHDKTPMSCIILRVSRFFDEPLNSIANYRLYRGLDVRDACQAHILAIEKNFEHCEVFNVSGSTPFAPSDLKELKTDATQVLLKYFPQAAKVYESHGWALPQTVDRVYVTRKAEEMLGYNPKYTFDTFIHNPSDIEF